IAPRQLGEAFTPEFLIDFAKDIRHARPSGLSSNARYHSDGPETWQTMITLSSTWRIQSIGGRGERPGTDVPGTTPAKAPRNATGIGERNDAENGPETARCPSVARGRRGAAVRPRGMRRHRTVDRGARARRHPPGPGRCLRGRCVPGRPVRLLDGFRTLPRRGGRRLLRNRGEGRRMGRTGYGGRGKALLLPDAGRDHLLRGARPAGELESARPLRRGCPLLRPPIRRWTRRPNCWRLPRKAA